jgi:uncharacterized iron-regulated membrane protein
METIIIAALTGIACLGLGAAGYRYYLKRDPAKLEALAQALKAAGQKIEEKVKE